MPSRIRKGDIIFRVKDPFGNKVDLPEWKWVQHIVPKHNMAGQEDNVRASIANPARARESTDPFIGSDTCAFEYLVPESSQLLRTFVLYENDDFLAGQTQGKVTTSYFPEPGYASQVGPVIWVPEVPIEGEGEEE